MQEEETYIIETILDIKDSKYKVKWMNYSEEEATWEPLGKV